MTAQVMCSATRCSRNARIWLVIELQVVTVSTVLRRPTPATRTHTLASFFEISSPAHRACTTSMTLDSLPTAYRVSVAGRAGRFESLTLGLDGTNPRFPWKPSATMLTYRLNGTTEETGVDHDEPNQYRPPPAPTATQPPPHL